MTSVGDSEAVIAEYHEALENFAEEQQKVLERILRKNWECEYLKRHGFNAQTDVTSFKELLPLIEYDAIEQDVKRIMEGDTSPILTCEEVTRLFVSSGTSTGRQKVLPVTPLRQVAQEATFRLLTASMALSDVGKAAEELSMAFATAGYITQSPGGLPMAAATTFLFRSPHFKGMTRAVCSPVEVFVCDDFRQSNYCHVLCGLLQSSRVGSFGAVLASGLASGFSVFKQLWWQMCKDIETGELSSLVTDPAARTAVAKLLLGPNKELADLVRAECCKDSWEGILLRLWPNAKFIECAATGSMGQYVDYINFFTAAQLPIISPLYVGSEGLYGYNPCPLNSPRDTFYVMLHNASVYFEFIKHYNTADDISIEDNHASPVGLSGVKEGEEYELVVTNGEGLWRYKVGDVLRCVGFYHTAPKFKFVGRQNVVLSIHTDKTEEKELCEVVNKAANQHLPANSRLYDFTSCPSLDSVPGHYVIYWEIVTTGHGANPVSVGDTALAEACFTMEAALSEPYRRGRIIGAIAPLELRLVRPGTFAKIQQDAVERGVSPAQFKSARGYAAGHRALGVLNAAIAEDSRSLGLPPHPKLNPVVV